MLWVVLMPLQAIAKFVTICYGVMCRMCSDYKHIILAVI